MPESQTQNIVLQASPFCALWDDDVTLENASELLQLLINKYGFNFNDSFEFADKLVEMIYKHADYAKVGEADVSEPDMTERRQAAELFREKVETFVMLNKFGYDYYKTIGVFHAAGIRADGVYHPHGSQVQPNGNCPPKLNFFNGLCHSCCRIARYKIELYELVPSKVEYIQAQFYTMLTSQSIKVKTKLMVAYQRARDLHGSSNG